MAALPETEFIISSRQGGVARLSLNRPEALNALNLEMIQRLARELDDAAASPDVAIVVIDSQVNKGFCAGGDVRALGQALLSGKGSRDPLLKASSYFAAEFALDHQIHIFPKPLLVLAHGITMGGGIGLFAGASHRVACDDCVFAMPEISIGYFPDVGASWFLREMPHPIGLYLGTTGARFSAGDARKLGLATHTIPRDIAQQLLAGLRRAPWTFTPPQDRDLLTELLPNGPEPTSLLWENRKIFRQLGEALDYATFASEVEKLSAFGIPEIEQAKDFFLKGSPNSRRVAFHQLTQNPRPTKKEAFLSEWRIATNLASHPDFAEGVRALLIDKDRAPRWQEQAFPVEPFFAMPPGFEVNPLLSKLL